MLEKEALVSIAKANVVLDFLPEYRSFVIPREDIIGRLRMRGDIGMEVVSMLARHTVFTEDRDFKLYTRVLDTMERIRERVRGLLSEVVQNFPIDEGDLKMLHDVFVELEVRAFSLWHDERKTTTDRRSFFFQMKTFDIKTYEDAEFVHKRIGDFLSQPRK